MTREGKPANILYGVEVVAKCPYEWESGDVPTGYNYGNDSIIYSSAQSADIGDIEISSVHFSEEFDIDGHTMSPQEAQKFLGPEVMKQLLNPALYSKLLNKSFRNYAEDLSPPEKEYDPPERDYGD